MSSPDFSAAPPPTPLVSVLVRSLDRPVLLQQALASVAAQTYPQLEVVVIAARPGHGPLPERIGAHALRLLATDTGRARSVAANAGLDVARGEYLLFLDDDDWLMPDHVARLVGALQAHPGHQAAYAGVALVDVDGKPLGQVFDLPFDAVRQLSGNLTPIHAVLFSARLRDDGCRFDETLDRYEDWDFWIQVARRTVPLHLGGVSAAYRIHASSGVHDEAGAGSEWSRRVQYKWLQQCTPQQLSDLMSRVWACDDVLQRLSVAQADAARDVAARRDAEAALSQAFRALAEQAHHLEALRLERAQAEAAREQSVLALEQQRHQAEALRTAWAEQRHRADSLAVDVDALRRSLSWRVTAPLRGLVDLLRGRKP